MYVETEETETVRERDSEKGRLSAHFSQLLIVPIIYYINV